MKKVLLFSLLLVGGLVLSQIIPAALPDQAGSISLAVRLAIMVALSFIMIRVGYEFDIDKKNLKQYGWDYVVAATAAAFPWIFVCLYFVFLVLPSEAWGSWSAWKESLLASRFAAPTSAGVLFSMLLAAGLGATWLFRKVRILAIFDDLDTVLLMIPLKMAMVGFRPELLGLVAFMGALLWVGYRFLHTVRLPVSWGWVLVYSVVIAAFSEAVYQGSKAAGAAVPIHIEVLLPAFVLGCVLKRPDHATAHELEEHHGMHPELDTPAERWVSTVVSGVFMVLVGLSMPRFVGAPDETLLDEGTLAVGGALKSLTPEMGWGQIALHVLVVTVLANLGKMFPALCYRREASLRQRLAVCVGMWPRGEVGAGVLVLSLSYGIGGPIVVICLLSLVLNLLLTGVFILIIRKLIAGEPKPIERG